jgi:hypothetical protein
MLFAALSLLGMNVLAPASAHAAPAQQTTTNPLTNIPVTGTNALGTFNGVLNITNFAIQNGTLVAQGVLNGTLTNAAGTVLATVTNLPVTLPLSTGGTCPILHLVLGPITLNLLGLQLTTNQIVIDLTAISGPGNLLGNLLCAVAHLLDSNASSGALQNLLNQLNAILAAL